MFGVNSTIQKKNGEFIIILSTFLRILVPDISPMIRD